MNNPKIHIDKRCLTCKLCAYGSPDPQGSWDSYETPHMICTVNKTYDVECSKSEKRHGCSSYHVDWSIYDAILNYLKTGEDKVIYKNNTIANAKWWHKT